MLLVISKIKQRNVFKSRAGTGSKLFSYLSSLYRTKFILVSICSLVETISLKIRERPLTWHAKCSLPFTIRGSRTSRACKLSDMALRRFFNF